MFCTRAVACVGVLVGAASLAPSAYAQAVIDCNAINSGAANTTFLGPSGTGIATIAPITLAAGDRVDFSVSARDRSVSIDQSSGPGAPQPILVPTPIVGGGTVMASFTAGSSASNYAFRYEARSPPGAGASATQFVATCTPAPPDRSSNAQDLFSQYSRAFLNARANLLLSSDPDRSRLARLNSGAPLRRGFNAARQSLRPEQPRWTRARSHPAGHRSTGLQLWSEAHVGRFDDDVASADRSGDFDVLYVGGDSCLAHILVGALVQFDWMSDSSDALNGEVDGRGWMMGLT